MAERSISACLFKGRERSALRERIILRYGRKTDGNSKTRQASACLNRVSVPDRKFFENYQVELSIDTDLERYDYDQENRNPLIDRYDVIFSRI